MMRCIGCSRSQIALVTLAEIVPLCIIGVLIGVSVGHRADQGQCDVCIRIYAGDGHQSPRRLVCGSGRGLGDQSGGAGLFPALQACRVSPLAATRPEGKKPRPIGAVVAAGIGFVAAGVSSDEPSPSGLGIYWFNKLILLFVSFQPVCRLRTVGAAGHSSGWTNSGVSRVMDFGFAEAAIVARSDFFGAVAQRQYLCRVLWSRWRWWSAWRFTAKA